MLVIGVVLHLSLMYMDLEELTAADWFILAILFENSFLIFVNAHETCEFR